MKDCKDCQQSYIGADDTRRCRANGLPSTQYLAYVCKGYMPFKANEEAHRVWFCEKPGRG